MKFSYLIICLIFTTKMLAQNTLSGKISNDSGVPLSDVKIIIKQDSLSYESTSNSEGIYQFENVKPGIYYFTLKKEDYPDYDEQITLKEDFANKTFDFTFSKRTQNIDKVEIIGRASNKYYSDYSFSATKIAANNKEIPLGISTVSKEFMADKNATSLGDVVGQMSSVNNVSYYNQFSIRGMTQNEEGTIINGMRTRQYYFKQPLLSNIEKIEVIKGPANATIGSVDAGGSIVMVTKKPLKFNRKSINIGVGSYGLIKSSLDFTGPLNTSKSLLYRINAAYLESKSFRDLQKEKALLISPSISYIPNDKTAINLELIYSDVNSRIDRGQAIFGAKDGATQLNSTPISFNMGAVNDFFKSKELIAMANFTHKFNDKIALNASYMKQTWTEDLLEHRTTNAFAVDVNNNPVNTLAAMQVVQRYQFWNTDNLNAYFSFDFNTGSAKHKVIAGYDYLRTLKPVGNSQNTARGFLLKNGTIANTYNPAKKDDYQTITVNGVVLPKPNVEHFDLANPKYTIKNINDYIFAKSMLSPASISSKAIYIQDMLTWNKFILLASVRQEWFEDLTNYEQPNEIKVTDSQLIPRLGLTYVLNDQINLYASYSEGFQPQSNTASLSAIAIPQGRAFKPLISSSKELGIKADFFQKKIHLEAAIFEINQKNILMNANDPIDPDLLVERGAERSRGFEIDIIGNLLPNWQIFASYAYNDSKIIKDSNPELIGARKQNTPKHSAHIWQKYQFKDISSLEDFAIGLGYQYSGTKIPMYSRAFKVPSYNIVDAAIYYNPKNSFIELALNVNNIFNTTYWVGAQHYLRLFPGTPRNYNLSATFKF